MFKNKAVMASIETILLIKEIMENNPDQRPAIFSKVLSNFEDIISPVVLRIALWILVEYSGTQEEIN